jgi:hypothetical protein
MLFVLILEFSEGKMSCFPDDVHIVEALSETVDDSGSEDVYEKEYSPSESDSDSDQFTISCLVTLWSAFRAVGMLFVLILEFSEGKMSRFPDDVHCRSSE